MARQPVSTSFSVCRTDEAALSLPAYRQQPHDTLVYVEADDGSQSLEGVIVDGQRRRDGSFDLDAEFTVFTTGGNSAENLFLSMEQAAMSRFSEPSPIRLMISAAGRTPA